LNKGCVYLSVLCGVLFFGGSAFARFHGIPQDVLYRAAGVSSAETKQSTPCYWEGLELSEKAKLWPYMTDKHQDFHWRQMSADEKTSLRSHLSTKESKKLRERFVYRLGEIQDGPYVLFKRLTKEELQILRFQIEQAHRTQKQSKRLKTPAEEDLLETRTQEREVGHMPQPRTPGPLARSLKE
jgi:hypothetical protein